MEKEIEKLILDFFSKIDIEISSLEIVKQKENIFLIKIKTPESGLVIWTHWKNLKDFEYIIKLLISRKIDENIKIHLEVNDYIYNKDQQLFSFIDSKIKTVKESKKDFRLPFLSAYERKKIHSYIAELDDHNIFTKSIWEWNQRRLYICIKDEKITIDLDWVDI